MLKQNNVCLCTVPISPPPFFFSLSSHFLVKFFLCSLAWMTHLPHLGEGSTSNRKELIWLLWWLKEDHYFMSAKSWSRCLERGVGTWCLLTRPLYLAAGSPAVISACLCISTGLALAFHLGFSRCAWAPGSSPENGEIKISSFGSFEGA